MLFIATATVAAVPISVARLQGQSSISLSDVYRLASAAPRVTAATSLAEAAQARVSSAKLPPDPELQLGFMNRELPSLRPMDPLGMTQIQLMQMLPLGGKLRLAGRVASNNADAARARATDVRWDVRARAAMQFYDLYAPETQLSIAR
jgi:outer membrane protein TolC